MHYIFLETPTDHEIQEIIQLYQLANWWVSGTADNLLVQKIVAGSHAFLVGKKSGKIVAMGRAISDHISDAYIQDITVHPSLRGQGIGYEVVKKLLTRLEDDSIAWVGLIAEEGATRLYEKFGFEPMAKATPMLRVKK